MKTNTQTKNALQLLEALEASKLMLPAEAKAIDSLIQELQKLHFTKENLKKAQEYLTKAKTHAEKVIHETDHGIAEKKQEIAGHQKDLEQVVAQSSREMQGYQKELQKVFA